MPSSARRSLLKSYGTTQGSFPTPVGAIHESPEHGWIFRNPNGDTQTRRGELCSPADGRGCPSLRVLEIYLVLIRRAWKPATTRVPNPLRVMGDSAAGASPRPTDCVIYAVRCEILRSAQNDRLVAVRLRANEVRPYSRFFTQKFAQ